MLGEAKIVFSANLQETLGISWYEGALVDTIPMLPNRLSYKEMALDEFKYPSDWTENLQSYKQNKQKVIEKITDYMENYINYKSKILKQKEKLNQMFLKIDLYETAWQKSCDQMH